MRFFLSFLVAFLVLCGTASAATRYVAPGATGTSCTQLAPCGSLDAGYQSSQPGDTVEVADGNYGSQTVVGKHPVGSAKVVFQPASGATVTIGDLSNRANEVSYIGLRAAPVGSSLGDGVVSARAGTNVLFQFVSGRKPYVWGLSATEAPVNNTFKGGVWREQIGCEGGASIQIKGWRDDDNTIVNPRNIVLDGLDISGYKLPSGCSGTPHQDCIHTFFVDGFTLRNSKIHGCEHFGILADSDMIWDASATGADNILIENNMFWDSGIADMRPRGSDFPGQEKFDGLVVRHNSTEGDLIGNSLFRNAYWQDNVSKTGVNCRDDITYGGNISPSGDGPCAGDRRAATGFVSATDFHLVSGAPAINSASGVGHPVDDIDGELRDSAPDAGADEFNGGTPPPPPAAKCADGIDNDGDGKIDYPADPGCGSAADDDEADVLPPPPPPGNEVLSDVADTYTDSGVRTTNFGTAVRLKVSDAPVRRMWVKFAKPAADTNATATLRFYSDTVTSRTTSIYGAPESWTESGLTHSNAPAVGGLVATKASLVVGWNTVSVPLSGQNTSDTLSFVLVRTDPTGAEVLARSREATEKPTLTIPR